MQLTVSGDRQSGSVWSTDGKRIVYQQDKEEAEQVYEIPKKEGRTVVAHFYPAEGHGFAKRENQIDSIRRTDWFDKYLKHGGSWGGASK